jgi:hypothetical protein
MAAAVACAICRAQCIHPAASKAVDLGAEAEHREDSSADQGPVAKPAFRWDSTGTGAVTKWRFSPHTLDSRSSQ